MAKGTAIPACMLACIIAMLMASCHNKPLVETQIAFSLSDTMISMCAFEKASVEKVKNEIRLFGKITADNSKMAQVYPVVGGVVTSINIELGDYVHQGQILATIQSSEVAQFQKEKVRRDKWCRDRREKSAGGQ